MNNGLNEQYVRKIIEEKGFKLNENWKYINAKTLFEIECEKGHRWETSWRYIKEEQRCPSCIKEMYEQRVRKFIEDKGGKLNKYVNAKTNINITCQKGHVWETLWSSLYQTGSWCPECIRFNYEQEVKKFVENKEGKLDSDFRYKTAKTKINVTCKRGHTWKTTWDGINHGHWCPECIGYIVHEEEVRRFIEDKGGKVDEDWKFVTSMTKINITCKQGHHWGVTWNNLQQHGIWCPECYGRIVHEEDILKYIEDKGGKLDSNFKYKNNRTKFNITCKEGHTWKTNWANINHNNKKHWCPECARFLSEKKFRTTIEEYFKTNFPSIRPEWLKSDKGRSLELDGYNEGLKIAFEYQGHQHYHLTYRNGKSQERLKQNQERDAFKVQRCKELGILLIVVPYWIPEKQWKQFIKEKYQEFICEKLAA